VDEQTRDLILERYRAHADRFEARTVPLHGVEPTLDASHGSAEAGVQPTARQREVLQLIADGLSNREIAERFSITEETSKSHLRDPLARLGARSRAEAVAIGFWRGLLS
jgi:DNA-binding CsgD family transcriptional regulator